MKRVELSSNLLGQVILSEQGQDDLTWFILTPKDAIELANRIIDYAESSVKGYDLIILEGAN